jgi:hypothetical protein
MPRIYSRTPPEQRFWQYVRKTDTCWLWTGAKKEWGYGVIHLKRIGNVSRVEKAHRLSWQMHRGPIPRGLFVCHSCDNPACVNPDHLFVGTCLDNNRDMLNKGHYDRVKRPKGERHGNSTTTEEMVLRLRHEYETERAVLRVYAKRYRMSIANVHCIVKRKAWKHI